MLKALVLAFSFLVANNLAMCQFVVKDVLVVDPQSCIYDPEFNPETNTVCWKSGFNELWVSGLDPVTHAFEPPDGKGTFVTWGLSPNCGSSWNGAEWMLSNQGTQIVFTKMIWGIRYPAVATQVLGGWSTETLYQYPHAEYVMASSDYTDSTARFLFETIFCDGLYWVKNTDLNTVYHYPDVSLGFFAHSGQQICCRQYKSSHPGYIEPDATPPYFVPVSQDTIGAPFMWNDPETGHRLYMYRTNGYKTMKIFEETAPADWVLFYSFDSPLPEFFPYITSPEPFVCGGKSYISFMAAQSESGKDGMPAQIWVAHAGPADSSMWRVSDSSLAVRTDPEPVVFSDSAFVYYSHVVIDEHSTEKYVVRKCDTGLSNFTTVNLKPQEPAGKLSVYPNPGNGFFTLNTSLEMGANPLLKISDASGRLMLSRIIEFFPATIDLREVPSGVYILTLSGEKQSLSTRIQVAAGK